MFPCRAQLAFVLIVVLLGTASMLQSCGQTGDLYLPDPEPVPAEQSGDNTPTGDA